MIGIHEIVSIAATTIMGILLFFIKRFVANQDERLKQVEKSVHEIREDLPKRYVCREDYRSDLSQIDMKLEKIYGLLLQK